MAYLVGVEDYLKSITKYKLISHDTTLEYFKKLRNGNLEYKEKITNHNLRLVISVVKKFQNRGIDLLDLIQEGNMGLLHAIDKFDYTRGIKFSTYATYWIFQYVAKYIYKAKSTVRMPVNIHNEITAYLNYHRTYYEEYYCYPTDDQTAKKLGVKLSKLYLIKRGIDFLYPESLDIILEDMEANKPMQKPLTEDNLIRGVSNDYDHLYDAIAKLEEVDRVIVANYSGIGTDKKTFKAIATMLNMTNIEVRNKYKAAIITLKDLIKLD